MKTWKWLPAVAVVAFSFAMPVHAQLQRCTAPQTGKVTYSDLPCAGSNRAQNVRIHETAGVQPGSRSGCQVRSQQYYGDEGGAYIIPSDGNRISQQGRTIRRTSGCGQRR